MKIYDQIRGDLAVSFASFMDEFQGQKPMSKYRQKDLETLNMLIRKYDDTRDAFYLRRDVKLYVSSMGSVLVSWISSLSVNRLKQLVLTVVNKPEYRKIAMLRAMHGEEVDNTLRVEELLTTKFEKTKLKMQRREDLLASKLVSAGDEIARLKREIEYLTKKLVSCRKALDAVENKFDEFSKQASSHTGGGQLVLVKPKTAVLVKNSALWSAQEKPLALPETGERRIGLLLE